MEHTNHTHHQNLTVLQVLRQNKKIRTAVVILVIATVVGFLFIFKNIFFVASVNGSLISRMSVVRELEKQGGKQVLESLVTEKLISNELKKNNISISDTEVEDEIKKIEDSIKKQGGTLELAMAQQGISRDQLIEKISEQKKIEKLVMNKIVVSDEDVQSVIKNGKITIPKGKEAEMIMEIKDTIKKQKLSQEVQKWLENLQSSAKITYFISY
jgi:foldase protein PrsA